MLARGFRLDGCQRQRAGLRQPAQQFDAGELPAVLQALLAFDEEMVAEDHRTDRVGPRDRAAGRLVRL